MTPDNHKQCTYFNLKPSTETIISTLLKILKISRISFEIIQYTPLFSSCMNKYPIFDDKPRAYPPKKKMKLLDFAAWSFVCYIFSLKLKRRQTLAT